MNSRSFEENASLPKPLPSGLIPTLNKMGYMTQFLDEYSLKFIDHPNSADKPLLEIGAAFGVATLEALKRGATVIANDLDQEHLKILQNLCPEQYKCNLMLAPGKFPDEIDVENDSVSAILICRVIHFFSPEEIKVAFKKLFDLLKKGGRLFLVADTPFQKNWTKFQPIYLQRKKEGAEFPGLVTNSGEYITDLGFNLPNMLNFMDLDVLRRELQEAGFVIEKLEFINRINYPDTVRLDGRESVGTIAIKP